MNTLYKRQAINNLLTDYFSQSQESPPEIEKLQFEVFAVFTLSGMECNK
jgi:hypothetical protein